MTPSFVSKSRRKLETISLNLQDRDEILIFIYVLAKTMIFADFRILLSQTFFHYFFYLFYAILVHNFWGLIKVCKTRQQCCVVGAGASSFSVLESEPRQDF
jgi:hypothetical protein